MDKAVSSQTIIHGNGDINWWGMGLYLATILVAATILYQGFLAIKRITVDETAQKLKMKELEANIRAIRGSNYETIAA